MKTHTHARSHAHTLNKQQVLRVCLLKCQGERLDRTHGPESKRPQTHGDPPARRLVWRQRHPSRPPCMNPRLLDLSENRRDSVAQCRDSRRHRPTFYERGKECDARVQESVGVLRRCVRAPVCVCVCVKTKHSAGLLTLVPGRKQNNSNSIIPAFCCTNIPRASEPRRS